MPYNLYKSGKKFRSRNGLVRYGRGGRRLPKYQGGSQFRSDIYGDDHLGHRGGAPNAGRGNVSPYAGSGINSGSGWQNQWLANQRKKNQMNMKKKMIMNERNNAKNRAIVNRSQNLAGMSNKFHRV